MNSDQRVISNYLVAVLPTTGKTTIEHELQKLGYDTINSDEAWGFYGNIRTNMPIERPNDPHDNWFIDNGYVWNVDQARAALQRPHEQPLFVCGGSRNEEQFYDLFNRIFVLYLSDEAMTERLLGREDPVMSSPNFIKRMVSLNQRNIYEHARNINDIVIDATQPVPKIVDTILSHCKLVHRN